MRVIRIGYNLFKGASQAGVIGANTPGNVEIETGVPGVYKLQIQRVSNDEYWNGTTKAWQSADPTTDDITIPGSESAAGLSNNGLRLLYKPSLTICEGIDDEGVIFTAYPAGDIAVNGAKIYIAQKLN